VKDVNFLEYRYLPGRALVSFVKVVQKLDKLPSNDKLSLYRTMAEHMDGVLRLEDEDKKELIQFFEENNIKRSEKNK
jgi:hypothetical protein